MDKTVFRNGQTPVTLNGKNLEGTGGTAIVLSHGNEAFKIWHQPDPSIANKLKLLTSGRFKLSKDVLLPKDYLTDHVAGRVIGYTMSLLPKDFREVATLFNKTLRQNNHIATPQVLGIFLNAKPTLESIHLQNMIVGDLSGRNIGYVLTPKIKTFWYDTDSYHLSGYPCEVFTPLFIDPSIGFSGGTPNFSVASDNYSFAVSLLWALTLSHPYHGTHKKIQDTTERAKRGLWVFHQDIVAPSIALNPDTLSDELLDYFERTFAKGRREPLAIKLLEDFSQNIIECPSCQTWYSKVRRHCPQCSTLSPAPVFAGIRLNLLFDTAGQIVFSRFQKGKVFVIAREKSGYSLYVKNAADPVVRTKLPFVDRDLRFEVVADSTLVVNKPGTNRLDLYYIKDPRSILTSTTSDMFASNKRAVFRGTSQKLLRLANRQLLEGEVIRSDLLERPLPLRANQNQTWFWSDSLSGDIVGLFQTVIESQGSLLVSRDFWLIHRGRRIEIDVPDLDVGEVIQDIAVKFNDQSILIRRLTRFGGREFFRTEIFTLRGEMLITRIDEVVNYPHNNVHGSGYSHGILWIPTDSGLLKDDLLNGSLEFVPHTAKAVTQASVITYLGKNTHFLVVSDRKVSYLVLPDNS